AGALARGLGVPLVVVTLGEAGCVGHAAGESRQYPVQKVEAVDTTGAGDAFAATLAASLAAGVPVPEAVNAAQSAAARTVLHSGGHESMPSTREALPKYRNGRKCPRRSGGILLFSHNYMVRLSGRQPLANSDRAK